jgi:glycine cleavage system aminomethyltransferase T
MKHSPISAPAGERTLEQEIAGMRASAGLVRCTWLAKVELQGSSVTDDLTPPGGCRCWRLGRTRALLTGRSPLDDVVESWRRDFAPRTLYTTDVTSVYADFLLIGPRSREILSKLTSMNVGDRALANASCGQTLLAHTHCIVLRDDRGGLPAYHLLVARDYRVSVGEALQHAGEEFELTHVGQPAVEAL